MSFVCLFSSSSPHTPPRATSAKIVAQICRTTISIIQGGWQKNYIFHLKTIWKLFTNSDTKGRLTSKCLFVILNSPRKRANKIDFTNMIPHGELFSFIFLGELKTSKRHFEINWPLVFTPNYNWKDLCRHL